MRKLRKKIFLRYWSLVFRFQLFRMDARKWTAHKLHRLADRIDPEHGIKESTLVSTRHGWVEGRSVWR